MKKLGTLCAFIALFALALPASGHIDLKSPTPLLDGKAQAFRALKQPPFGAPGVDVLAAPVTVFHKGSMIEIEVEVYVYHPGEIVVLYTLDSEGKDVAPAMSIPTADTPIPHHNLIFRMKTPDKDEGSTFRAQFQLPDIEGTIYLVVRQVMTDKLDPMEDGSVSLKRIYYHQAAKLELVK